MTRRAGVIVAVAAAAGWGCQDIVSAPGVCPEFCPEGEIRVVDTLLTGVEPVGSYTGYLLPHEARQMQVVGPGGPTESRALLVSISMNARYAGGDTTVRDSIIQTDSLSVRLNIVRRNAGVSGVTLAFHEIPLTPDSATTYGDMTPYFQDSTLVATLQVPDSLVKDTLSVTFPAAALRHFGPDTLRVGIGVRIVSPEPAFVTVASDTIAPAALIRRFVQVDSSTGTTRVTRSDTWGIRFRTFVVDPGGIPSPVGLTVGGATGARGFVKLNLPGFIVDSTLVVRATLLLPATQPVFGAPGDTFSVRVVALGSDFGPKSPVADTSFGGTVRVAVGGSDTVAVDITRIFALWRGNAAVPRTVMFQVEPEAASINTLELPGQGSATPAAIRVTYAPPFRLPGS
ncbi:MAG TPA: hypothetical protein VJL31_06700 [Gemmatimonadales bacterium]|nr:hypothetical protein [Gemmatimonadales bacterium]